MFGTFGQNIYPCLLPWRKYILVLATLELAYEFFRKKCEFGLLQQFETFSLLNRIKTKCNLIKISYFFLRRDLLFLSKGT